MAVFSIGLFRLHKQTPPIRVENPDVSVNQHVKQTETQTSQQPETTKPTQTKTDDYQALKQSIEQQFRGVTPKAWGETLPGIKTKLETQDKVIALTFDACGGEAKDGYDHKLIEFLEKEQVPATLFVGGLWIDANKDTFLRLAHNPFFEIENHGARHRICSVNGRSMYGLVSDQTVGGVVDEIETNARRIESLTGRKPIFYRSAGAYTDEVCPQIASVLGETMVNFDVLGDAGATYSRDQVKAVLLKALPGSIVIMHMNHPEKDTAEGVMAAIPALRAEGFRFVKLSEYPLQ